MVVQEYLDCTGGQLMAAHFGQLRIHAIVGTLGSEK